MRAHATTTTTRLALLLSLLALGALGMVACGGGGDDQTTAASETEPTQGEPAADNKPCGSLGRGKLAVVGGVPCDVARNVMRVYGVQERNPGSWKCYGGEGNPVCLNEAHGLNETVGDPSSEVIVGWCCGVPQRRAYIHAADQLAVGVPDPAVLEALQHHVELLEQVEEVKAKFPRLSREQVQELQREATIKAKFSQEQVQQLKREANTWASLFADRVCNRYMGQPMCVRLSGSGPGAGVHAPRVSAAFQKSFAGATVEDIKSERIRLVGWTDHPVPEAAVEFSNGEVVVFDDVPPGGCPGGPCSWGIAGHNHRFLEAARDASIVKVGSKIILGNQEPAFHGRVKSSRDDCVKHRKVKVFRKRKGQDKLIGKDRTSRNGRWLIDLVKRPGTYPGAYQAKVRRKRDDRNGTTLICKADTSVTRYWH